MRFICIIDSNLMNKNEMIFNLKLTKLNSGDKGVYEDVHSVAISCKRDISTSENWGICSTKGHLLNYIYIYI